MVFADRWDAGRQLTSRLLQYKNQNAVALALPRGGVPVGYEIARALEIPLSAFPVRKIGAPSNPEYAIGALAPNGVMYLEKDVIRRLEVSKEELAEIVAKERKELRRRQTLYRSASFRLKNKIVILIDDGLATGATAKAAIMAIRKKQPKKIILAVPGCPSEAVDEFEQLVDEFVSIEVRDFFTAVGSLYEHFEQIGDEEVLDLLKGKR